MLLAVDIGNSFVKIALLREEKVVARLSLETERGKSADEYLARIAYSPLGRLIKEEGVEGAILSSVVSSLTPNFLSVLERLSGRKPLLLGENARTGIALKVDHPLEVGSDLVAASSGAVSLAKLPSFIADLGTASKFIYVDKDGAFRGVAIAPGIRGGALSLREKTSSLPEASLSLPPSPLGKNTFDSLNAGLLYGTAYECLGFLHGFEKIADGSLTPYLTGGNARFVKSLLPSFVYEPDLLMKGLSRIYARNQED